MPLDNPRQYLRAARLDRPHRAGRPRRCSQEVWHPRRRQAGDAASATLGPGEVSIRLTRSTAARASADARSVVTPSPTEAPRPALEAARAPLRSERSPAEERRAPQREGAATSTRRRRRGGARAGPALRGRTTCRARVRAAARAARAALRLTNLRARARPRRPAARPARSTRRGGCSRPGP